MLCVQQEPDAEASNVTVHDVPTAAVSEPNAALPTCASIEDEIVSDEQVAVSAADVAAIASPEDSFMPLPIQSTDTLKPEPVFAPASVKPRQEVKNDLSSMFKSLSAKMKMKHERQSRFSDIVTAASPGLPSSEADAVVPSVGYAVSANSESNHFLPSSLNAGTSSANEDTAYGNTDNISVQPSSPRGMRDVRLAGSNQSIASVFNLQNFDMQMTSSSTDRVSSFPLFSQTTDALTRNNGMIARSHDVTSVIPSRLGL